MFKRLAWIAGTTGMIAALLGSATGVANASSATTSLFAEIPKRATLTLSDESQEGGFFTSGNTAYVSSVETVVEGEEVLTLITVVME